MNPLVTKRCSPVEEAIYQDGYQAGAASRDAEIARLKTVPMRYRRMAFNAQLQDEAARLEQENDQLRAQIKQKDAEIADLLDANRIACEDLVEQQNLRVKYAGQIEELVAALESVEWTRLGEMPEGNRCCYCGALKKHGHVTGCKVANVLKRTTLAQALAKVRKP